jgi:hypothetical protein
MMYYYDTNTTTPTKSFSNPGDRTNMAIILTRLTLVVLLVGVDSCPCGEKTLMHDLPLEDHRATFPLYTALKS